MLAIMEKYANNLEVVVAARTAELLEEKKKTEALLHRMLPRWVQGTKDPGFFWKDIEYRGSSISVHRGVGSISVHRGVGSIWVHRGVGSIWVHRGVGSYPQVCVCGGGGQVCQYQGVHRFHKTSERKYVLK